MKDLKDMQPLNSNEDYLYGINARLDVLINIVTDLLTLKQEVEEFKEEDIEEVEEVEEEEIDYTDFTVKELKGFLEDKDIEFTSNMRKADLIELLK